MTGYMTLDCRDGVHSACAVCSCRCHGSLAVPSRRQRFDPILMLIVLTAVAVVLVAIAVLLVVTGFGHGVPVPMVTDQQLVTE